MKTKSDVKIGYNYLARHRVSYSAVQQIRVETHPYQMRVFRDLALYKQPIFSACLSLLQPSYHVLTHQNLLLNTHWLTIFDIKSRMEVLRSPE